MKRSLTILSVLLLSALTACSEDGLTPASEPALGQSQSPISDSVPSPPTSTNTPMPTEAQEPAPTEEASTAPTFEELASLTCSPGELSTQSSDFDDLLPTALTLAWCGVAKDGSGMILYGTYASMDDIHNDADALDAQYSTAAVARQDSTGGFLLAIAYDAGMTGPNDPAADLAVLKANGFEDIGYD